MMSIGIWESTMQMTNTYSRGFAYVECLSSYLEANLADFVFSSSHRATFFLSYFLVEEITWETNGNKM